MAAGRKCETCLSDKRTLIDLALSNGQSSRRISAEFGIGVRSIDRHRLGHLKPSLARAAARREDLSAEALVEKLLSYIEAAEDGIKIAQGKDDLTGLARCIKEAHAVTLSLGKTIGLWSDRPQIINDNRRQIIATLDAKSLDDLLALRSALPSDAS